LYQTDRIARDLLYDVLINASVFVQHVHDISFSVLRVSAYIIPTSVMATVTAMTAAMKSTAVS